MKIKKRFLSPFTTDQGLSKALLLLFILINSIVLYNAIFHDPRIGYDTAAFLLNIDVLSAFRLPLESDTTEFFSPPLPFILPALFEAITERLASAEFLSPPNSQWLPTFLHYRFLNSVVLYIVPKFSLGLAAKFAQLLNLLYSLVLTFFMLKIGKHVQPKKLDYRFLSLGFLGIMPVYYKSFAFVRPEPLLASLTVVAAYLFIKMLDYKDVSLKSKVQFGGLLGLIILARQWGFFLLVAIGIFLILQAYKNKLGIITLAKTLSMIFGVAFVVGGWFYLHLMSTYGSPIAYNRDPQGGFTLNVQPAEFYTDLKTELLFIDPVQPSFQRSIVPIFYSEFWGDYDQFFSVAGVDKKYDAYIDGNYINTREIQMLDVPIAERRWSSNRFEINAYLGRVNLAGLLPTAIFLAGFAFGLWHLLAWIRSPKPSRQETMLAFSALVVSIAAAGFLFFLIQFSFGNATTAKATYMLEFFPFVAFLAAGMMLKLRAHSKVANQIVIILLALITVHNLPMFFTNYNTWLLSNLPK